ncbi:hypothetical protein [Psychrobium sp. 1_MG-2023]|uniref:hypothetical protein n=1 Tax=Psychrobium sp. 1_MG-2023 TaxID=3062624 RepID=UPI000C31D5C1|nr:hypothetical protein [Psychrobium sp. 1_MG-2023]MDP2560990.1 hypothetical protein [Psychrobium sp. 1_MG-2023]PKF58284.1 hypothetical protein CW748_03755 [Alteromonadales bacterium alter-6D02]
MNSYKKRLLALVPVVMLTSIASTSYLDEQSLFNSCKAQYANPTANNNCQLVADTVDWFDWLTGSSSSQFHFIDLLELITPVHSSEDE